MNEELPMTLFIKPMLLEMRARNGIKKDEIYETAASWGCKKQKFDAIIKRLTELDLLSLKDNVFYAAGKAIK